VEASAQRPTLGGGPGFGAAQHEPLDRAITRPMLLFFVIGDILGGGIYALTGEVADKVGAVADQPRAGGAAAGARPRRARGED
jgi:hypothetical protein